MFNAFRWIPNTPRTHKPARKASTTRLVLELLEDRTLLSGPAWNEIGPRTVTGGGENVPPNFLVAGAVEGIAINPHNSSQIYVGTVNGGIWRTNNADVNHPDATSWTPLTDQQPDLSIGEVAFSPLDSSGNTLFAATGPFSSFGNTGGPNAGILRTTDGGSTWQSFAVRGGQPEQQVKAVLPTAIDLDPGAGVQEMVLVGTEANQVFLGTTVGDGGLYRSDDNGQTFTMLSGDNGLPSGDVTQLIVDPNNPEQFYAGLSDQGVFRGTFDSSTKVITWTAVNNVTNDPNKGLKNFATAHNIQLAATAAGSTTVLYALLSGPNQGAFRSTDQGNSWTALATPPQAFQDQNTLGFGNCMVADPTNSQVVYIATGEDNLFRFNPAGAGSWVSIIDGGAADNTSPHTDFRDLTFLGTNTLVVSSDGGIFFIQNPQDAIHNDWHSFNGGGGTGLGSVELYTIAWDSTFGVATGGTQDNGTVVGSAPGSLVWSMFQGGDGGDVAVDSTTLASQGRSIRYASSQQLGGFSRFVVDSPTHLVEQVSLLPDSGLPGFDPQFQTPIELNAIAAPSSNFSRRLVIGGEDPTFNRPQETLDFQNPSRTYSVFLTVPGQTFVIDMSSSDLFKVNPFLQMLDGNGNVLQDSGNTLFQDDAGNFHARIVFTVPTAGNYQVVATDGTRAGNGPFSISFQYQNGQPHTIYESSNAGIAANAAAVNWVAVPAAAGFGTVTAMAYGGTRNGIDNPDVLYAGSNGQVFVRTSAGGTLNPTAAQFPGGFVRDIVLDPTDFQHAIVISGSGVWETSNLGGTWTDRTGNLDSIGSNFRTVQFVNHGNVSAVLVGGQGGVFVMTTDNPGAWNKFGTGLPNTTAIMDLAYNRTDDILVASTLGRGAWTVPHVSASLFGSNGGSAVVGNAPDNVQVTQGQSFQLHSHATANAGDTLTFQWDINGDGDFSDAVGANPIISPVMASALLTHPGTFHVQYRVSNGFQTDTSVPGKLVVFPADLVVDSPADVSDGDFSPGHLSLREAIEIANIRAASPDTIRFSSSVFPGPGSTITLGANLPQITVDLSILGLGADKLAVSGNANRFQVFNIASNVTVSIFGLTIEAGGGAPGGGIANAGTLFLSSSTLSGNTSTNDGGGISNTGTLTVNGCTISGNSASHAGGGIANEGTATLINSTLSGNSSQDAGGGFFSDGSTTAAFTNVTVTGNRSDSDGNGGGDGGGIDIFGATVRLDNTIVAGNFRGTGTFPSDFGDGFVDTAHSFNNLIGDNGSGGDLADGFHGNIVGINGAGTRPIATILNTTLANNGGPTLTHDLVPGSPAIGKGNLGNPVDQRGFPRSNPPSIGAVEPNFILVTTTADEDNGSTDPNLGSGTSLREAVAFANSLSFATTILFASNLTGTLTLTLGQLTLTNALGTTIAGPGAANLTIDGNAHDRIFQIATGAKAEISGLTLQNGRSNIGGAIFNKSTLTLANDTIQNSQATGGGGGGIDNFFNAALTINSSTIAGNTASQVGGGISNVGTLTINGTTIAGNTAPTGGGIENFANSMLTLTSVTVQNNTGSTGDGGGITNAGTLTITSSTLSNNSGRNGGALFNDTSGSVTITASTLNGNQANGVDLNTFGNGGAIRSAGALIITNSTISGNSANREGGGISTGGTLTLINCTVVLNNADANADFFGSGGGIRIDDVAGVTLLSNTIVAGNQTLTSGGSPQDIIAGSTPVASASSFNLIGAAGSAGGLSNGTIGNIVGVNGAGTRPIGTILNTTLTRNGGPTLTHALASGSPAIDAGSNGKAVDALGNALLVDQRGTGFPRTAGVAVDIGAFEDQIVPTAPASPQSASAGKQTTFHLGSFTNAATNANSIILDWGDSSPKTILSSNPGTIADQAHKFTGPGTFTVTVSVVDGLGDTGQSSFTVNVSGLSVIATGGATFNAVENTVGSSQTVATFTDPDGPDAVQNYSASIDWGDGSQPTTGTIVLFGSSFSVNGNHLYAEEGIFPITVTISHGTTTPAVATSTAEVADPFIEVTDSFAINAVQNVPFTGQTVATFTDPGGPEASGNYSASIDWGDGSPATDGTITFEASTNTFSVTGGHTYLKSGGFFLGVSITHKQLPPVVATSSVATVISSQLTNLAIANLPATGQEGVSLPAIPGFATFTDPTGSGPLSDYTATVNWGDNTSSPGNIVALDNGNFRVDSEFHTYVEEGTYLVTVTVTHNALAPQTSPSQTIVIADQQITPGIIVGLPSTANLNSAVGPFTFLGEFNDPAGKGVETVADFTGTINWGDGTTSPGTVEAIQGSTVYGVDAPAHTYTTAGRFAVTVTFQHDLLDPVTSSPAFITIAGTGTSTVTITNKSPGTSFVGAPVTFTAKVTPTGASARLRPTGTVTFLDGVNVLGSATLSPTGVATAAFTTMSLQQGVHNISAVYNGDTLFAVSNSASFTQTVNAVGLRTSSITLTGTPLSSTFGKTVTFTARVTDTGTAPRKSPTGLVEFLDGATVLGVASVGATGLASFQATSLLAGTHSFTAVYLGNANFAQGPSSSAVSVTVNQARPSVRLTSSVQTVKAGIAVTFTASLTPATATGTVTFMDGSTPLGPVPVNAGRATFSTTALALGKHSITAVYGGDNNFSSVTSGAVVVKVGTANQFFVNNLIQKLLGRSATLAELTPLVNQLDAQVSRMTVVNVITSSLEYRQDTVDRIFQHYLGRSAFADPNGLNGFVALLNSGGTQEQVAATVAGSPEYFARAGNTNQGFLNQLFNDALSRAPAAGEQTSFLSLLNAGTPRTTVAQMVLTTREYHTNLVNFPGTLSKGGILNSLLYGYYQLFLGRNAQGNEAAGFIAELDGGSTDEVVIAQIAGSAEFFNKSQPK